MDEETKGGRPVDNLGKEKAASRSGPRDYNNHGDTLTHTATLTGSMVQKVTITLYQLL